MGTRGSRCPPCTTAVSAGEATLPGGAWCWKSRLCYRSPHCGSHTHCRGLPCKSIGTEKQSPFPLWCVSPAASADKPEIMLANNNKKYLKGPDIFSQSRSERWIWNWEAIIQLLTQFFLLQYLCKFSQIWCSVFTISTHRWTFFCFLLF